MITKHKNSIFNQTEIKNWVREEFNEYGPEKAYRIITQRIERAEALLPNIKRYFSNEFDKATEAVELWKSEFEFYKMPF